MPRQRVDAISFIRAETDRYFDDLVVRSAGVNRWHHTREPAPVDMQAVVRMNRDTLYSSAIVDISQGATLTMPQTSGRYQTTMVVDEDHYIDHVFDSPGEYRLEASMFPTSHVALAVRTLVDPADPADLAEVVALQDQLRIEAESAHALAHPAWDTDSLDETRALLMKLAAGLNAFDGAFGSRSETDPILHLLGTAAGWGGLPTRQATYIGVSPNLPPGHYVLRVPRSVPVRGFWSVSVYNSDGYFEPNDAGRYSVNSVTAVRNPDGGVTINLGGDALLPNAIPLPEGWNYTVRLYHPEPEILDKTWSFPTLSEPHHAP
jgi:hypothetical protein